jgi:hypothetical protein
VNNKTTVAVISPKTEVLYLDVEKDKYADENDNLIRLGDWNILNSNEEVINFGYPKLDIVKSETDSFEMQILKYARGTTKKEALSRANAIMYNFSQTDSLMMFSPHFSVDAKQKWRDQRVKIILKVPVGKTIYLSENTKNLIYDIENVTNTWDGDMIGRRWIMTKAGLKCVDCEGLNKSNHNYHKTIVIGGDDDSTVEVEEENGQERVIVKKIKKHRKDQEEE